MARARTLTYKQAGVDIDAGEAMVEAIRSHMQSTYGPRVIGGHGGFAGLFRLDYNERLFKKNYREPVLVGCTDGVGSKVLVAVKAGRLDTVGIDLVAMSVNDLLTCGAEPLFFLDYLAVHRLAPDRIAEMVAGVSAGCREAGCALLGGETAEMPGLYRRGEFDMAGFAVGVVERHRLIDGRLVEPGDVLVGLPSDGLHSNGYTLVQHVLFKEAKLSLRSRMNATGRSLADELLRPTRIYVKPVLKLLSMYRRKRVVKAMAHITGGGLPGNLSRVLPDGCAITIRKGSWPVPPIFDLIQRLGVAEDEMHRVFNMGIGYVLIVRRLFADAVVGHLQRMKQQPHVIGRVRRGDGTATID